MFVKTYTPNELNCVISLTIKIKRRDLYSPTKRNLFTGEIFRANLLTKKHKVCKSCFGRVHFITLFQRLFERSQWKMFETIDEKWKKSTLIRIRTVDNKRDGRHTDLSALYTIFFYCAIVVCIAEPLASRR